MICATTGHRLRDAEYQILDAFTLHCLSQRQVSLMYIGMALGWDMAMAEACDILNVPFVACVPFIGQDKLWCVEDRERYRYVLGRARDIVVICQNVADVRQAYHIRNSWMVKPKTWELPPDRQFKDPAMVELPYRAGISPEGVLIPLGSVHAERFPAPTHLLAFWNGELGGGTGSTVKKGEAAGLVIENTWSEYANLVGNNAHG